jgi:hypothetical protein
MQESEQNPTISSASRFVADTIESNTRAANLAFGIGTELTLFYMGLCLGVLLGMSTALRSSERQTSARTDRTFSLPDNVLAFRKRR